MAIPEMAKMQISKEDKVSADPIQNAQLSKRGECISIVADAHEYSASEKAIYAIVEVPGIDPGKLSAFVAADVHGDNQYQLLRRRAFRFDLDRWNGKPLTLGEALALKVRHTALHDPDVLGAH